MSCEAVRIFSVCLIVFLLTKQKQEVTMRVLVTGGAGYIGSHVVLALLEAGHSVVVYDNLSTGCRENLFAQADFVEADILDMVQLREAMSREVDAVIHFAALKAAGESMTAPEKYTRYNICGTLNVLQAASLCDIRKIIFSSSATVYGEPQYLPMDEAHPLCPDSYYGFTKLSIEQHLDWYDRLKKIRFAALRYFNAAGYDVAGRVGGLERNPANLLPVIMEVAAEYREKLFIFGDDYKTRDGTGLRDYIHVSDLARAHVLALNYIHDHDRSLTVNLGSEQGSTVSEVLETARRITGKEIPAKVVSRRAGDPSTLLASAAYARECLGWEPGESDLDTIVASTWQAYTKYGA